MVEIQTPYKAYSGEQPYVFVCYSHADSAQVYADLKVLHDLGMNIWYDEGISPGRDWSEELAHALNAAECVLFYASSHSIESRHCRDEINFAHGRDKAIYTIFLEDVALPVGLELSLSATQAIKKFSLPNPAYVEKLRGALPASIFSNSDLGMGDVAVSEQVKLPWYRHRGLALGLGLFVLVAALGYWYRGPLVAQAIVSMPAVFFNSAIEQEIGFATTDDGVSIAYATTGEGPPLLIAIGWATHLRDGINSPTYDPAGLLELTSRDFRVIRFDGRGFGLSDRDVPDMSLEGRVKDIEAVVDALQLDDFYLYGVSAGGQASIKYAAKYPHKVKAMVISGGFANTNHRSEERQQNFALMLDVAAASWEVDAVADMISDVIFHIRDPIELELTRTFLRRSSDGQAVHDFHMTTMQGDAMPDALNVSVPTLVMQGRDDLSVPLEAGKNIASSIPGARFAIVEGGHVEGTGNTLETRQQALAFFSSFEEASE